jgi:UDP-glucuronate 4-epimerase
LVLNATGISIIDGDICDGELLTEIFAKTEFTHIINLAAQPGVRYSFVNPLAYIRNNLQCFTTLLDTMRLQYGGKSGRPMPRLLYASSSSVYGINTDVPFSEEHPVVKPSNLYGATKRANELIAHSYHHLFGMSVTGFRFFTVYGPWGRPDMAAYIFTKNILSNKTITMYNDGDNLRDFTYIDDIVAGLTATVRRKEDDGYSVYNLGNSKPVSTKYFLELLETLLQRKASVRFEVSKAEMPVTYANTTAAKEKLGFQAKTSIEEGLKKYMDWFRGYETQNMPCESGCSQHEDFCFKSGWGSSAAASTRLTKGCAVSVYTVSTSLDTSVLHPAPEREPKCNIALISEKSKLWLLEASKTNFKFKKDSLDYPIYKNWTLVPIDTLVGFSDPRKATRVPKIAPEKFFAASVTHAIYLDSSNQLTHPPEWYIDLTKGPDGKTASMVAVQHARSSDVFDEYSKIIHYSTSRPKITHNPGMLEEQIKGYQYYKDRNENVKFNNVFDGSFLVHDLKSPDAEKFRCRWFEEYMEWSDRDQISGSFVLSTLHQGMKKAGDKEVEKEEEWHPVYDSKASGQPMYVRVLRKSVHPMMHRPNAEAVFTMARLKYAW